MAIEKKNVKNVNPVNVEVLKVKPIKDRKDCYRFNLRYNGVTIYGMQYVTYTTKDGGEGYFISFPQYRGNDDKYYNHCYFEITKEVFGIIEKQIGEKLS